MRPRPIYRWKSFWFGLLTLAFMALASWDSTRYGTTFIGAEYFTQRINGEWRFGKVPNIGGAQRVERDSVLNPTVSDFATNSWRATGNKWAAIPDAAIFFPFLFAWIAFLGWRWRRQNKAKAPPAARPL